MHVDFCLYFFHLPPPLSLSLFLPQSLPRSRSQNQAKINYSSRQDARLLLDIHQARETRCPFSLPPFSPRSELQNQRQSPGAIQVNWFICLPSSFSRAENFADELRRSRPKFLDSVRPARYFFELFAKFSRASRSLFTLPPSSSTRRSNREFGDEWRVPEIYRLVASRS